MNVPHIPTTALPATPVEGAPTLAPPTRRTVRLAAGAATVVVLGTGIAGVALLRDDPASTTAPPATQVGDRPEAPAYTGDWKDSVIAESARTSGGVQPGLPERVR